ncbi:TonB-dependent receptor plug domain-containing protein [Thauera linaloolentis]|uniref:Putative TonB-dependent receptor n=1 Tax=Thauera linaloolentis (strain DSM 12138 / JCM 21573 / CCUG 41526 / CIP 105981 / IAM 15112 / NBRC 102519 / 47Lol) TaxID=1123367 RepID=N6Y4R5_THAL4|nr:TonB-dependent receptor [Thauera linaloolentis]ENO89181.1 putative TonB-dependent receptor [Thauera linaloolentis 47Lol = DSM 12138]MCM8567287.1 TonB-dependent receptor [Thauera linaloolentis]
MPIRQRHATAMLLPLIACIMPGWASAEDTFFQPLPVVLSASRLPQSLQDTPGAVTVIDADLIGATGYRELPRLFRLVPGMQVAQERGNQQRVTYHGLGSDHPNQMQVLIDGRSVYSPHYSGGANWRALPVALEDIERIEIVRGSNSATYGSNAFLGVVNLITRHTGAETGSSVSARIGNHGIADVSGRAVLRTGALGLRLSVQEQRDDGWSGLRDDQHLRAVNLRGDLDLGATDALEFSASYSTARLGEGYPDTLFDGSGLRDLKQRDYTVHATWRHIPSFDEEWSLSWYRNREHTEDAWHVDSWANCPTAEPTVGALCAKLLDAPRRVGRVDNNRNTLRDNIALQHRFSATGDLRMLWGTEWRYDRIESDFLYESGHRPSQQEWRLFGNAEWRAAPEWLWNFGAMAEHIEGDRVRFAPRIFLNWQPQDNMTWRMGFSRAWRQPTLHERWTDVLVSVDGLGPVNQRYTSNPRLRPQQIDAWEIGYLGSTPWGGLLDVRVFDERIDDYIRRAPIAIPAPFVPSDALHDATGGDPFLIHHVMGSTQWTNMPGRIHLLGLEYRLSLKPRASTTLLFTHTLIQRSASNPAVRRSVAPYTATLTWMEETGPWRSTMSLLRMGPLEAASGDVPGLRYTMPAYTSLDWSIARSLRAGSRPVEVRLTATNLLGNHQEQAHKPLQWMPHQRNRAPNKTDRQVFLAVHMAF